MSANEPRMDLHPLRGLEDEFEFVRELGRGGSSVVYLAVERELEREVAIKTIHPLFASDPDAAARLEREARTLARLEHPNIVTFYGVRRLADGGIAMVMQYVRGERLKDRIRAVGRLAADEARRILIDVTRALGHAHRHHVVHRDIKPENIYLDTELGIARLSDFGIARAWDQDASLTQAGLTIGTPAYMAPEQIDGLALDGRSDLYSLGLVGWEMLSGQRPWDGFNLYGIIYRQKHEALAALSSLRPDVPEALCKTIETALQKDPANRWPTAEAFLARLLGDERVEAPAAAAPPPPPPLEISRRPAPPPTPSVADDSPTIPYRPAEVVEGEGAGEAPAAAARPGPGAAPEATPALAAFDGDAITGELPVSAPEAHAEAESALESHVVSDGAEPHSLIPELAGEPAAGSARDAFMADEPELGAWSPFESPPEQPALPFERDSGRGLPELPELPAAGEEPIWPAPAERPLPGELVQPGFGAFDLVPAAASGSMPDLLERVRSSLRAPDVALSPEARALRTRDRRRRLAAAMIVLGLALGSGIGAISLLQRRAGNATPSSGAATNPARRGLATDRLRSGTTPDLGAGLAGHASAQLAAMGGAVLPAPPEINLPDLSSSSTTPAPSVKLLGTPVMPTYTAPAVSGAAVPPAPPVDPPTGPRTVASPNTTAPAPSTADLEAAPTFTPFAVAPRLLNRDRVGSLLARVARERAASGHIVVWIFVSQNGVPQKTQVKESSGNAALDSAALEVAASMRFSPALNGDQHIPVWVAMPIDITSR